ncbi:putative glucose-methanol-choline oxidoreductase [Delitschia confertaspora ATCC 74209]|uniref:Glucose-methanol-choline oxidoreductase n=1 Tax=Delitschia confertaspora ATCC 74209 TaxID=1513339 RepID=A0A9P4MQA2_9PLEO|nr:putative glucose-methanol-choline oxidoreductase [Delitschia confertaspora ATCC 74209]
MAVNHFSCSFIGGLLAFAAVTLTVGAQKLAGSADYVIVGGGPAGFVLAEQLSRNPKTTVVLLEAGPDAINDTNVNTPAHYPLINPQYFWNFSSQPDPNLGNNSPEMRQGRLYGGGSGVNGQAYCRGSASVFDEWAKLSGNSGLAWPSMLESFKATSHYSLQSADYEKFTNTSVFGYGPLEVSRTSGLTGFEIPFANALKLGFGLKEIDMSDGTGIGVDMGLASIYTSNRTRSYARNAFGRLIEHRPNVQMIDGAWVNKIGFNSKTAVNVTYVSAYDSKPAVFKAKEIIISAGAINTPKLLMLSGVGPKQDLSKHKIPVVADIAEVGKNLKDHYFSIFEYEVSPAIKTVWQWAFNATASEIYKAQYAKDASGPLGWDNGLVYAGIRLPDTVFDGVNGKHYTSLPKDRPHILIEYSTVPFIPKTDNISTITAWASLVQPESSGYITLKSADYRDDPLIFSNYYGTPADKRAITYGYKKLREILGRDEFKGIIKSEFYPGLTKTSEADVWTAIQNQAFSFHHPLGTVAIGKVLDKGWRVKGLKGLRVVDISTFPSPPTCHPQADVYALAHRAAQDIIKADRR